jgi:hypothetical protein
MSYRLPPCISADRIVYADKSVAKVVNVAKKLITKFYEVKGPKCLGFVFDVDDTLIRDDDSPIKPVVGLYHWIGEKFGKASNRAIVTARSATRTMMDSTIHDLRHTKITKEHMNLMVFCPERFRDSPSTIGAFKKTARQVFQSDHCEESAPIVLTVGDQWTDMCDIPSDVDVMSYTNDLAMLVRLNGRTDGVCVWGLKLPATA